MIIHKSLLGDSNDLKLNDNWYFTGDLIEKKDNNYFKIKGRQSEVINVGGYNVSPSEVEEIIRKNDFVIDVLVKGRSNKLIGNIIEADIIKSEGIHESELRKILISKLNAKLQAHKIPRIYNFVKKINKSRTGKIKRK